jgi:hypothetical protein
MKIPERSVIGHVQIEDAGEFDIVMERTYAAPAPGLPDDLLREVLTHIQFAHRHLLGDSDVSRDDASAALVEAERDIRIALAAPATPEPARSDPELPAELRAAAGAVDALWDEPDRGDPDAAEDLIWMTHEEVAMRDALRSLRKVLLAETSGEPQP